MTLRSAASFGSFHLIRLLFDEYMFYLVEQKVARSRRVTSIAAMAVTESDEDNDVVTNGHHHFQTKDKNMNNSSTAADDSSMSPGAPAKQYFATKRKSVPEIRPTRSSSKIRRKFSLTDEELEEEDAMADSLAKRV